MGLLTPFSYQLPIASGIYISRRPTGFLKVVEVSVGFKVLDSAVQRIRRNIEPTSKGVERRSWHGVDDNRDGLHALCGGIMTHVDRVDQEDV